MTFTLIILLLMFIFASYLWWQGHSGYWREVTSIYSNKDFPKLGFLSKAKAHGFCFYRKPHLKWISYNAFLVSPEKKGLYIADYTFGIFYPSVCIPWSKVHILRAETISISKKLILAFADCPGEFAIPISHQKMIKIHMSN